jgi:hypothetical protein
MEKGSPTQTPSSPSTHVRLILPQLIENKGKVTIQPVNFLGASAAGGLALARLKTQVNPVFDLPCAAFSLDM